MRVAAYYRVSTKKQDIESQVTAVQAYCQARQFQLVREYSDIGISGTVISRPGIDALLTDARAHRIQGIVVFRLDRLFRRAAPIINLIDELRAHNIATISVNDSVDTSTPMGSAMLIIISALAQLERDAIKQRVMAGLDKARAKGKRLGRPREIDSHRVLELRASGQSYGDIARAMGVNRGSVAKLVLRSKSKASQVDNTPSPAVP